MAMMLLAVVAAAIVGVGSGNLTTNSANLNGEQAYYAAEAGGEFGLYELKNSGISAFPLTGNLAGNGSSYTVNATQGPGTVTIDGTTVTVPSSSHYYLEAIGVSRNGVTRRVGVMVQESSSAYNYAGFAVDQISVSDGSRVDSWDSSAGPYSSSRGLSNLDAHLGTNQNLDGSIRISGGSMVDGNAYAATGAGPDAVQVNASTLAGVEDVTNAVTLPPVSLPTDPTTAPNRSQVGSGTLDLSPGTYGNIRIEDSGVLNLLEGTGDAGNNVFVFNSLVVRDSAVLQLLNPSSPIKIIVKERFLLEGGGIVNNSLVPPNLEFQSKEGPVRLKDGSSSAYYSVYAPEASIDVYGGSSIYGAIVGNDITIRDAAVHYDLALQGTSIGSATNLIILSRERI